MEISFEDFKKLDIRVGKIVEAEKIEGTENLLRLIVDFKNEKRQAVSGIAKWYKPEELKGKKYVFILNIEKKKFFGVESQCMILAAEDDKGNVVLIKPEKDVEEGSRIT